MDKVIRQGLLFSAGFDAKSKDQMQKTVENIIASASNIDFNTPENKKSIQSLVSFFRDVFESVGNKKIDFTKMLSLPGPEMFDAFKASANEMADVWADVVSRMGTNSLRNVFMKDERSINDAFERLKKNGTVVEGRLKNLGRAFNDIRTTDINKLLNEAIGEEVNFTSAETWEERAAAALRYIKIRDKILNVKGSSDFSIDDIDRHLVDSFKNITNSDHRLGAYFVRDLKEAIPEMQTSLNNIFNLYKGLDIEVIPRVVQPLSVNDLLGTRQNSIEIPVELKIKLDEYRSAFQSSNKKIKDELENEISSMFPEDIQDDIISRLWDFGRLGNVGDRNYNAIWKYFVKNGMPVGDGTGTGTGTGTGDGDGVGDGSGSGPTPDDVTNAERIAEANRIAAEQAEREKAAKDYILSHRSPLGEKYDAASEDVRVLVDNLVRLDQQLQTLDERTAATQMDGFDKWNPSDEHKATIVNTLNEYQSVMKQISEFSIETDDDKKKLIELKEEALQLANTLQMAYRSDSNPDSYIKDYGISRDQAIEFMDINNVSSQLKNEILTTLKDSMHSVFGEITKMDGQFARMLLDNVDDWEKLRDRTTTDNIEFISEEEVLKIEDEYDKLCEKLNRIRHEVIEAEKELEKLQNRAQFYGFGSDKTPAQEGRIQSILSKNNRGKYVVDMLKNGYQTMQASNGEYGFDRPDLGKGVFTQITKTEYEYAQYLSQKIQELNVGWDEGLKILQSQNGQLEAAQARVEALRAEEDKVSREKEAAYEAQAKAHNLWNKQRSAGIDNGSGAGARSGNSHGDRTQEDVENARKVAEYEAQARIEAEAKEKADRRRKELAEQLDLYDDDDSTYDLEESEGQKAALQEILNALKQENLLTDELQAKYDSINSKIDERISLLKSIRQAYDSLETVDNIDYNMYDADEVQQALDRRKEIINAIPQNVLDNDDDIAGWVEEIEQGNLELEKRIGLLQQVKQGLIDIDSVDDIMSESGDLDSKLSRLQDVASAWGSDVKDDEVDEDDDALEALREFEETYDRIVLKLANGRKIEILPNAKGLRALHKYDDGIDSGAYGETEIEDIEFVRKEIQQTTNDINAQNNALEENANIKTKTNDSGQADGATSDEVQNLEAVRAKVAEITSAVEAKTTAFQNEKTDVDTVVDEEVKKLDELEEKVKSITTTIQGLLNNIKNGESNLGEALNNVVVNVNYPKSEGEDKFNTDGLKTMLSNITYKVKLSKSETDKNANKIELDESVLTNTLETVFADILHKPEAPAEAAQEPWARETTLGSVKDVLTQIQTNTTPIVESKTPAQPKSTLPETRLGEIKELLSQINGKISGKISGVVKSETTDKYNTQTTKKKHKDGTISHGKANGEFGSPQKMLDYYYWLEEQVAQHKDNAMYVEELNKVIKQLTPRVIEFYKDLVESGKEDPAWLAPLNEKHNLHMSKIRGGQSLAEDKKEAKDTQRAIEDLLKAYERLGKLRAERDMLPQGVERDELQKEIKREGDRLRHRSARLGVDSTRTQEAADVGAHSVQYDQLIDRVERLGKLEEKLVSLKKGTGSYKDTENEITNLNREIALIEKKVKLTQEEKIELDKIRRANADAVNQKTNQQADASASAEQQKKIQRLTALYRELGVAEAKLENSPGNIGITNNISELKQQIQLEGDLDDALREQLETTRQLAKEKKARSIAEINGRKSLKEEIADNKKSASANKVASSSRAGRDVLFASSSLNFDATENNAEVKKLTEALEHLDDVEERLAKNDWVMNKGDKEELAQATSEVNKYTEAVKLLVNSAKMFGDDNSISLNRNIGAGDIKTQLVDAAKAAHGAKFRFEEFDDELQTITGTLKVGPREFRKVTIGVNQFSGAIRESQGVLKKTETFIQSFKRKLSEISSYFSASSVIFKAVNEFKKGIQYVREIDLALTELKKVTSATEAEYDQFLKTAAKTGAKLGSTISAVTEATATFAKLGYSMQQASEMAEAAIVYKNVGDNIASTEDAADSIISTLKGFGLEASESMAIVDKFNEVGNRFAITSQGIGEALRLSASALNEGKNSLDESIALITAANEVVRFVPRSHSNMVTRSDLKRGNS